MKRNKFSLSHYKLFSCDMGELIPCSWFEVLPGDTIQISTSALVRAAYLLAPVMHPVDVRIHHWYVPNRLLWDDWEKFITGGPDGMDATQWPRVVAGNILVGTLDDYLGVPLGALGTNELSALPYRAYAKIYNEFYRDQDLQLPIPMQTGNGVDGSTSRNLAQINWEKDYFTSARPWEQKGPVVTLPLGSSAPLGGQAYVSGIGVNISDNTPAGATASYKQSDTVNKTYTTPWNTTDAIAIDNILAGATNVPFVWADMTKPPVTGVTPFANLAGATAVTIGTLRDALAIQRYEEARARYGSRYTEYLRYLGVKSSDARLQLPEYLGGGRQTIQFSEVLQTGPEAGGAGVGKMRGHGLNVTRSRRARRFIEEHGIVMTLMSVRPKTIYMQGTSRGWFRHSKDLYWQKEFEHVGQQEVYNREIKGTHATPGGIFGYQDRYDEYRRVESSVAGEFRTSTLNHWHMARDFATDPALNASFVQCVPTERTFAVPSEDVIYVYAKHSIQARRLLSSHGGSFTF